MTFKEAAAKAGQTIKQHAPEILTGVSVVGIGGTAFLTGRASYKAGLFVMADASARMDAAPEGEDVEWMDRKEIFKQTWKFYIPAVSVGLITCVAVIGSNRIGAQRNVALISAAAIGERAFQEYRDKVAAETTKPKERKIHDDIAQDTVVRKKDELDRLVVNVNEGDVLCLETHTGRTFISTAEKIHRAENDANRECLHDGQITANTFFSLLGLPYIDAGEVVGWDNGKNRLEVKIGGALHRYNDKDLPVLTVGYYQPPSVTFNNPF